MLLTNKINVEWNKRNKKHLESFGHLFTFYGDIVEVNTEYAPKSKEYVASFQCDGCFEKFDVSLSNYSNNRSNQREFGVYFCHKCSANVKSKKEKYTKNASIARPENILSVYSPKVFSEWNYEKNIGIDPLKMMKGSNKKVWWICCHGHEWQATINNRTSFGQGCPYCAGKLPTEQNNLEIMRPELIKEWNYKKNKKLPSTYMEFSHKKVWWLCSNRHEWNAKISDRSDGNGCPYCSNKKVCDDNCLDTLFPDVAAEWNTEKNKLTPKDVLSGSHKKVWWICEHGHEWEAKVHDRAGKSETGCPTCSLINRSGENHYKWRGGISPLTNHIRQKMEPWRIESIKKSSYKCVITGKRFEIIHHLYSFNEIFRQTFEELNIPICNKIISDYTLDELKMIEEKCLEIHYRYPLGVGLTNEIHDLFHREYGNGNNTPEQFEEFKIRYKNNTNKNAS